MSEDYYGELTEFDSMWPDIDPDKEYKDVPDGIYQVRIDKCYMTRTKTTGKPMLKWELVVLAGEYVNRVIYWNNVLGSKNNIKYLKGNLIKCGMELDKVSDLPDRTGELLDKWIMIKKKKTGEYTNCYIQGLISPDDDLDDTGTDTDEDIPF